jgi:pheromone shutdown protein TraB
MDPDPHTLHLRTRTGGHAILVGTGHLTGSGKTLVTQVVEETKPNTIVLELDGTRLSAMRLKLPAGSELPAECHYNPYPAGRPFPGAHGLFFMFTYQMSLLTLTSMLPSVRRVQPGQEFAAACAAAPAGTRVLLGDRDSLVTLRRLSDQLLPSPSLLAAMLASGLGAGWVLHPAYRPSLALTAPVLWAAFWEDWEGLAGALRALSADCRAQHGSGASSHAGQPPWCPGAQAFNSRVEACIRRGGASLSATERAELEKAYLVAYAGLHPGAVAASTPAALGAERDFLLALSLYNAPGEVVVGVLGKAHLPGVQRHWKDFQRQQQVAGEGVLEEEEEEEEEGEGEGEEEEVEEWEEEEEEEEEMDEEEEERTNSGSQRSPPQAGQRKFQRASSSAALASYSPILTPQQRQSYQEMLTSGGKEGVPFVTGVALPALAAGYLLRHAWRGSRMARGIVLTAVSGTLAAVQLSHELNRTFVSVARRVQTKERR